MGIDIYVTLTSYKNAWREVFKNTCTRDVCESIVGHENRVKSVNGCHRHSVMHGEKC